MPLGGNIELKFGVVLFSAHYLPFQETIKNSQFVEKLGYDSIWMGDHFYNRVNPKDPWFEPWTTLAALATKTTRIRLGTLVTNFIYRNPVLVAQQALTVEHISNGRLELGLGTGVYQEDHTMAGIDYWPPKERVQRFHEGVQIVDLMLRNPITSFQGKYYRVDQAVCNPSPIQDPRPPFTIAAFGKKMMRIAAEFADSWNTLARSTENLRAGTSPTAEEALNETKRQNEQLNHYCKSLGRNPLSIKRSLLVGWTPDAPIDSLDAFYEFVEKYSAIGITEFIFYWLTDEYRELIGNRIRCLGTSMIESIAQEGIPKYSLI
ncbi:LLM class flavin-dependent oxidoreductase [Candidatus Dependentiae bacterium]|nr:MAG: LLM class flavin-dependent oxidoreductase [Candidatus Dependentiae bacterium]